LRNGGGRAGRRGLSSNNKLGFVDESLFVERFCFRQPKFWRPKKGQKKAGDSLLKVLEKEEERKKERRKEEICTGRRRSSDLKYPPKKRSVQDF